MYVCNMYEFWSLYVHTMCVSSMSSMSSRASDPVAGAKKKSCRTVTESLNINSDKVPTTMPRFSLFTVSCQVPNSAVFAGKVGSGLAGPTKHGAPAAAIFSCINATYKPCSVPRAWHLASFITSHVLKGQWSVVNS